MSQTTKTQTTGIEFTLATLPIEKISVENNYRDPDRYDAESMMDLIIRADRITDELWVSHRPDAKFVCLRGHRRLAGVALGLKRYPEVFKPIAAKIPVKVFEGLTAAQEADFKLDHSGQKPLSTPWELFLAMENQFLNGMSEKMLAVIMTPLFLAARGGRKKPKLYEQAMATKDIGERHNLLLQCWRGQLQCANYITQLPVCVREHYKATVRDSEDTPNPFINAERIGKLHSAFLDDKTKAQRGEIEDVSKDEPGPAFKAKWDEYKAADQAASEGTVSTPKRKTMKELEQMQNRFSSQTVRKAFAMAMGKEVTDLPHFDQLARMVEVVDAEDKGAINALTKAYKAAVEKRLARNKS